MATVKIYSYFHINHCLKKIIEKIKGRSWKEGAPTQLNDLSYLKITHLGFDDEAHVGEMIVNKKLANEVLAIFRELYEAKFPIEKIKLIDEYEADDNLSMSSFKSCEEEAMIFFR